MGSGGVIEQVIVRTGFLLAIVLALPSPAIAFDQTLTDQQIAAAIIQESRQAYYATGRRS
jgi:hypothetical protein